MSLEHGLLLVCWVVVALFWFSRNTCLREALWEKEKSVLPSISTKSNRSRSHDEVCHGQSTEFFSCEISKAAEGLTEWVGGGGKRAGAGRGGGRGKEREVEGRERQKERAKTTGNALADTCTFRSLVSASKILERVLEDWLAYEEFSNGDVTLCRVQETEINATRASVKV